MGARTRRWRRALLSSRPDLLPDVYIDELGKLVDEVPPVPFEQIRKVIASEVGLDAFAEIDPRAARNRVDRADPPRAREERP